MDAMDNIVSNNLKEEMKLFTVKTTFIAHGTTEIEVVYTNDISQVEETLEILKRKQLKQEYDKEFMGLDFEYTNAEKDKHEVAVVQLCVDKTVLVWQLSRPKERCESLFNWFRERYSKFASVDITGDKKVMERTWGFTIPLRYHVDIQDIYNIRGSGRRTGMATIAGHIIDDSYKDMKYKFPEDGHKFWDTQPLDEVNLRYAAIDGFVAFELYRRLQLILKGLVVLQTKPNAQPA
ncbi:unnamed protein product [Alopecurus aequalis]